MLTFHKIELFTITVLRMPPHIHAPYKPELKASNFFPTIELEDFLDNVERCLILGYKQI
jgi:hypothetical protein